MEFKIENASIYGLNKSMIASGNAMRTIMANNEKEATENDFKRSCKLGTTNTGEGHDNFFLFLFHLFFKDCGSSYKDITF